MALFSAIVVAELPAIRNLRAPPPAPAVVTVAKPGPVGGNAGAAPGKPRYMVILPHGDENRLPRHVLDFCFPDLDQLVKRPFHYDHTVEEFAFTLTPKDEPRMHGFVRRYRVGAPSVNGRLDLSPFTSANVEEASTAPVYQCICILSERPYHRFFGQCLQLLHAARLCSGAAALRLARQLLLFGAAPPGSILPLRGLLTSPQIPGALQLPRERLRVPPAVGLPYYDVPLAPLLNRLDAPALLMLYSALLCERRIMMVAQSIPTLTACVHAAVALLQPFEWQHILIPVLSATFLPNCAAPQPFIIGVTPAQFAAVNDELQLGDIVCVAAA